MALNDITLRSTTYPPLTTKGSALTFGEMDDNFIEVYAYLVSMNSGGGVPPFSMATGYTGTVWVAYAGKIYRHIGAGTSTGQIPPSFPAVWQEVTSGELTHVQGTDQGLDTGGANAVTAAEIKELVGGQYITSTLAAFNTLVGGGNLKPNRIYALSNAISYGTLLVRSVSTNKIAAAAQLLARVPDVAQLQGTLTWVASYTYTAGDLVARNGLVYENLTGTNTGSGPEGDATNWQVYARSTSKYVLSCYDVQAKYDGSTFELLSGFDPFGNSDIGWYQLQIGDLPIQSTTFYRDNAIVNGKPANSAEFNKIYGAAIENVLVRSSLAIGASMEGNFYANVLTNAALQVPTGVLYFYYNNVNGATLIYSTPPVSSDEMGYCNINFPVGQNIYMRSGHGMLTNITASPAGSNAVNYVGVAANDINRSGAGPCDIYGVDYVTSMAAIETVDTISNDVRIMPIKVVPMPGLTLNVTAIFASNVTANGQIVYGNGAFALEGTNGDYMVVKPVIINGFDVYQVTELAINN